MQGNVLACCSGELLVSFSSIAYCTQKRCECVRCINCSSVSVRTTTAVLIFPCQVFKILNTRVCSRTHYGQYQATVHTCALSLRFAGGDWRRSVPASLWIMPPVNKCTIFKSSGWSAAICIMGPVFNATRQHEDGWAVAGVHAAHAPNGGSLAETLYEATTVALQSLLQQVFKRQLQVQQC